VLPIPKHDELGKKLGEIIPEEVPYIVVVFPGGPGSCDGDLYARHASADQLHLAAQSIEGLHQLQRRQEIEEAMKESGIARLSDGDLSMPGRTSRRRH
jgi:hypothetical protein